MSSLYIKVDDQGVFENHPHFRSNLEQLYPNHDFSSGPPNSWMEFERVAPPALGPYEKFDDSKGGNIAVAFPHNGLEYSIVDGKYKDVWHVLNLTDGEKLAKQNAVKGDWSDFIATSDGADYSHYVFDEVYCAFVEPEE